VKKTENEVLRIVGVHNPLPSLHRQQELLDLYFTYVHPHFPIMFSSSFMRQYEFTVANPNSVEPSTSAGAGKVPVVLLLAMFALSSRYSDALRSEGDDFFESACRILNHDFCSSRLVTCQVMLLLAYREIGAYVALLRFLLSPLDTKLSIFFVHVHFNQRWNECFLDVYRNGN
jgi:hypothetical protein